MTENEPMSFARNDIMRATEAALKAYDQGVEDGIRQERERIREALLSDGAIQAAEHGFWQSTSGHDSLPPIAPCLKAGYESALDHIGLGEETADER